jgi:hypothetical protein
MINLQRGVYIHGIRKCKLVLAEIVIRSSSLASNEDVL